MTNEHSQRALASLQQLHDANNAEMDAQAAACALRAQRFAAMVGKACGGPTTAQEDAAFSRAWKGAFETIEELPPVDQKRHRIARAAERFLAVWGVAALVVVLVSWLKGSGF